MNPNFLIIGAARSATTSLYKYLEYHPDVFLPAVKEINYFSNERFWQKGSDWYKNHFRNAGGKAAIGEASTSYTSAINDDDTVPKRIKETLGEIKLVYILRDPIDRALSHYMHYYHRSERTLPVSELITSERYADTRWQGKYAHQIDMYMRHFAPESLLVITVDQLREFPQETMSRIFAHIGVSDMDVRKVTEETHNANDRVTQKGPFGSWVMNKYQRHIEQREVAWPIKKLFLNLANLDTKPLKKPSLTSEQVEQLKQFYAKDMMRLQEEHDLDLSAWKTVISSNNHD